MSDAWRVLIRRTGGPDVLEREQVELPVPGAGEVRLRHEAIGVNFIDTYYRSGLYPAELPTGLGGEAAGVVEAVGPDVSRFAAGDRVAYATIPGGAYATARNVPADRLVRLPDAISAEVAAAALLKGMTVDMLVGECGEVAAGMTVLVHAAAGGVGSLLVQWAKALGATVIAHAGSPEKAERAAALGADHALHGAFDNLAAQVRDLTGGRGVEVAFDGIGKASWAASLASTARRGLLASYGNASGAVPPFAPLELSRAGSLFLTRPTLFDYVETPERLEASAGRLWRMIEDGKLRIDIGQHFPLAAAAEAHRALEGRSTTGSTVLLP